MSSDSSSEGGAPFLGSPCWIQIPATNVSRAKDFYSAVFEWDFTTSGDAEMIRFSNPSYKSLSGGIVKVDEVASGKYMTSPSVYFLVSSIEEGLKRIEKAGGNVVAEKEAVGDHGWTASFKDTEGNVLGIYCLQK